MANLPIAAGIVRPLGSIASNAGQKVALSATSAQTAAPVAANMVFLKSDIAGYRDGDGYLRIGICGGQYRAHRLAWLYMTGKWPIDQIDHKNAVKNDNRWKNLREATCAINNQNKRKALRNNRTGFLGVSRNGKGFIAQIKINEKRRNLGTYPTPELAHEAYLKAKRELHAGCTL